MESEKGGVRRADLNMNDLGLLPVIVQMKLIGIRSLRRRSFLERFQVVFCLWLYITPILCLNTLLGWRYSDFYFSSFEKKTIMALIDYSMITERNLSIYVQYPRLTSRFFNSRKTNHFDL